MVAPVDTVQLLLSNRQRGSVYEVATTLPLPSATTALQASGKIPGLTCHPWVLSEGEPSSLLHGVAHALCFTCVADALCCLLGTVAAALGATNGVATNGSFRLPHRGHFCGSGRGLAL